MAIFRGSRYEQSKVDFIQTSSTSYPNPVVFYNMPSFMKTSYYEHVCIAGERIDQISSLYYKTPSLWWIIAAANPSINDVYNTTPGSVIKVPRV